MPTPLTAANRTLPSASMARLATGCAGTDGRRCRLVVAGKDCFVSIKWVDYIEITAARPAETAREIALRRIGRL